ncbi:hypothetical protein ABMA27_000330 [Loxostege sticticalis]|uniref:Nuclease HARBI1 n=1 Tax=Loxostege sticticalis TaxID=481309 RepID=A0ABR3IN36_LOXSC
MASLFEILKFLEADNSLSNFNRKRRRMSLRRECDPFQLEEDDLVRDVCKELRPTLRRPTEPTDLSEETKVLTTLYFYATGTYQRATGNAEGLHMAQKTVSDVIREVTKGLNSSTMREKYIHFPATEKERTHIKTEFYRKFGIPGVLGCIDCTHVAIVRPNTNEERYYNRKGYHSLNVQIVGKHFTASHGASRGPRAIA